MREQREIAFNYLYFTCRCSFTCFDNLNSLYEKRYTGGVR